MARRQGRQLAKADPQGRVDVMLYRIVERGMQGFEQRHGVAGLRENLLPIVERLILAHVPAGSMIPQEVAAFMRVLEANRQKGRAEC